VKKISDQVLAGRLLKIRDQGGVRLGLYLRWNYKRYAFLLLYFTAALAYFAFAGLWMGFALVLGMNVGFFARDFGWVNSTKRSWPFTLKITDWALVEALASEKPPS
jgi:hypothetical protein